MTYALLLARVYAGAQEPLGIVLVLLRSWVTRVSI